MKEHEANLFDTSEDIKIFNMHNKVCLIMPWDVRVDRQSPLGNPFPLKSEKDRDKVCDEYEEWFTDIVNFKIKYKGKSACEVCSEHKTIMAVLHELERLETIFKKYGGLNLYCWCAPKRCHAETIRNFILGD